MPEKSKLLGYNSNTPVFVNVTRAESPDADETDMVLNQNIIPAPVFVTAPWIYALSVTNTANNVFGPGAVLTLTGSGLSTQSTYQCVWNNTDSNMLYYSTPSNPTSKTTITCNLPDSVGAGANPGDSIELANISLIATTLPYNVPGYVPIVSNTGGNPTFAWPAGQSSSSGDGLSGGAVAGIVIVVLVVTAVAIFLLYKFWWSKRTTDAGYVAQTDRDAGAAGTKKSAAQIQYNPSSYQSTNENQPFQASEN